MASVNPPDKDGMAQSLVEWGARNGLISEGYSGEVRIDKHEETVLLDLEVPEGHTWYSTLAKYSVEGNCPARFRAYRVTPGGEKTQVAHAVLSPNSSFDRDTRGKWPAGSRVVMTVKPDPKATSRDLVSIGIRFVKMPFVD